MKERASVWSELQYRPLVLAAVGLVFGILATKSLWAFVPIIALVFWPTGLRRKFVFVLACVAGLLVSRPAPQPLVERQWMEAPAVVASVPRLYPDGSSAEISVKGVRLLMRVGPERKLVLGDRLEVMGFAAPFREGTEGNFPARGVVGKFLPEKVQVVRPGPWVYQLGSRWRDSFVSFCESTLSPRAAAAVEAICFNVDTAFDPEDRDALRRSGLVHIVSASGFHVGVLALALAGLLSVMPLPRAAQLGIIFVVLALYATATGMRPPVIRAALMAIAVLSAYLFQREPDYLSALALAAVVQLLWLPTALFDPGFQLSFGVVAALVLFAPIRSRAESSAPERIGEGLRHGARQSVVAILAAAPIVGVTFRTLSLTALPSNALATLVLPVITVGAMVAHLVSLAVPVVGVGAMKVLIEPLVGWLYLIIDTLGGPWAGPQLPVIGWWWAAALYGMALSLWRPTLRPAS